jgi:intraflagellar transport protein 81
MEMLDLLNKIFIHLDNKWAIDIRNENHETIIYKITESLKILNY